MKIIKNKVFCVPIGNAKNREMHDFDRRAPGIKYVQDDKNSYYFISLYYVLFDANEHVAENAVVSLLFFIFIM